MPGGWSRTQALNAFTDSIFTRDLRHVHPASNFPRAWRDRKGGSGQAVKCVPLKDRIKWWNIVPGDKVQVAGGKTDSVLEVVKINRLSNRVLLRRDNVRD